MSPDNRGSTVLLSTLKKAQFQKRVAKSVAKEILYI